MSITSKLRSLIDSARGLIGSPPGTPEPATDAVEHDRYEERMYRSLLQRAPALRETVGKLTEDVSYADDLMRDTLMQLWQGDPRIRPREAMDERRLVNHAVALDMAESDALKQARQYTLHDEYGAAMAAIGLSQHVHDLVKEHEKALEEAAEEDERAREEAEQAQRELSEQADAAEQAAQEAEDAEQAAQAEADASEDGQPSDEAAQASQQAAQARADAMLALQRAMQDTENANQQAQAAADALRDAADRAQRELRKPAENALREAAEDLEEEERLFAAWGVEPGEVKRMDFKERQRLAQALRGSKLAKYIDLIGRFRLMAAAQRVRKVEYGRDQVVGTELSGDLSRVVVSELTALAMGDDELGELMELDFYRRWFEDQLISREFEGTERVGKGAIIAVWDESGSMEATDGACLKCGSTNIDKRGTWNEDTYEYEDRGKCKDCSGYAASREAWAKAFALSLLDAARHQKRDFVGIGFSSRGQQVVYRFPKGQADPKQVLEMVEHFFGGGTNFERPLDKAVDILESEFNQHGRMKGDLVFITDDGSRLEPDWLRRYLDRKETLGFRTFGVALAATTDGALKAVSDNVRKIDTFADPTDVRDVFQII